MSRHDEFDATGRELVLPRGFDALLAERAELLEAARAFDEAAARLRALLEKSAAIPHAPHHLREWPHERVCLGRTQGRTWTEAFAHRADGHFWEHLLELSGLERMFGPGELEAFRDQLGREHIVFEEEAALATLRDLASRAPAIFAERCHTIVASIGAKFATNDGFGLGHKFIWTSVMGALESYEYGINYYAREKVWDLDAVFHQLDSKAPPARREGLVGALDAHGLQHRAGRAGVVETDYFRVKIHKNQNVHFTVLDPVLLKRFNALVQDHRWLCHRRPA